MTEYKFDRCIVRIHGKEPDNIKEATTIFMKKVEKCRKNSKSKTSS